MKVLSCEKTNVGKLYTYEQIKEKEGVYRPIELLDSSAYLITLHDAGNDSTVVLLYDKANEILCPADPECWLDDVFVKVDKQVCFCLK